MKTINGFLDHIHGENPSKKRGYCYFCPKKTTLKSQKEQKLANSLFQRTFNSTQQDWIEVQKRKEPKRVLFRSKQTRLWCFSCQKFICKDCWNLYH
jgi:hypothetical protein